MTLTPVDDMGSKVHEIAACLDDILNNFTYEAMSSEGEFRNIVDSILKINFDVVAHEILTKNGKIDTLITHESRVFIIEYKYMKSSSVALQQINDREYYGRYVNANMPVLLFGISLMRNNKLKRKYVEISYDLKNSDK
jgi:hypothetical protein